MTVDDKILIYRSHSEISFHFSQIQSNFSFLVRLLILVIFESFFFNEKVESFSQRPTLQFVRVKRSVLFWPEN